MDPTGQRPPPRGAAVAAIVVTYFYFLIFAEFAFLELARATVADGEAGLRPVLGALGAAGMLGSLLAAWRYDAARYGRHLALGFATCAAGAGLALRWPGLVAAGVTGLGTGWLTVTLATGLRGVLGSRRLGTWIGAGTGAAYALGNVPVIFNAAPAIQAALAAVLAVAGGIAAWPLRAAASAETSAPAVRRTPVVVVLLALVGLDSATFYLIQHVPALKAALWGGAGGLWANAAVHFGAAVLAGRLLDAGRGRTVLLAAYAGLTGGALLLRDPATAAGAGGAYVTGVSLYSTALVFFPAQAGAPWFTAAVFALAGWAGSALGVGWGLHLQPVPPAGLGAIGLLVIATLWWRHRRA